ncbi:hypothetical protein D3C72_1567880 [compost metagenome]
MGDLACRMIVGRKELAELAQFFWPTPESCREAGQCGHRCLFDDGNNIPACALHRTGNRQQQRPAACNDHAFPLELQAMFYLRLQASSTRHAG